MEEATTSPFIMSGAREMLSTSPAHVEQQVAALEAAAATNPGLAFDLAKTLLESTCKALLAEAGIGYENSWDLPRLLKETLKQIQLVPPGLDLETQVSESLRKTAGGLQTTIQGICELRNSHGFASHGKDPAFQALESVQALLVARAVDAIVSFLFRSRQRYQREETVARLEYADHSDFNDYVDESYGAIQVFSEQFEASRVLFEMAPAPYRAYLAEFQQGDPVVDQPAQSEEDP